MNNTTAATAAGWEEEIAETIFFLKGMVGFFNRQHASAKSLIAAGKPFLAATPLGYAFDAERSARELHDKLASFFTGDELLIDDESFEVFCESETLYRQALATEQERKAACQAEYDATN
ncbi:MAG: hypothetical protein Q4P66_07415 [Actinomycetaceae bacterium]|nr:hypothetical protein [Actinomycetaceae bacterium]